MPFKIRSELNRLIKQIIKNFNIKEILLFGSYAYGKPANDSDIDLCIIIEESKRKIDLLRDIRRLILPISSRPIDILLYNQKEFEERAGLAISLEYKIKNEGLILYAK